MKTKSLKLIVTCFVAMLIGLNVWAGESKPFATCTSKENSTIVFLHLNSKNSEGVEVKITNAQGEYFLEETILNTDGKVRPYNFKDVKKGIYIVEAVDKLRTMQQTIQIENGNAVILDTQTWYNPFFKVDGIYLDINMLLLDQKAEVLVYDKDRNVLLTMNFEQKIHTRLDIEALPIGSYYVKIVSDEKSYDYTFRK